MSYTNRQIVPYGYNDKLGKSVSHSYLQTRPASMYIPPYTPKLKRTYDYPGSPTNNLHPTFIIQHTPAPPSPISPVNHNNHTDNRPWFLHGSFVALSALFLTSIAVTLYQVQPLINSSASAVHNVGQVFGATAHMGHALGDSVGLTTRVGKGVTGAVGDLWCMAIGGSQCYLSSKAGTASSNNKTYNHASQGEKRKSQYKKSDIPPRARGAISGDMALATMYELGMMPSNLTAASKLREVADYLSTSPYLQAFSTKWWIALSRLSPGLEQMWKAREGSTRTAFNTFRIIVDQFETAEKVLALPPIPVYLIPFRFISHILQPTSRRNILLKSHSKLHRSLVNLVIATHSQTSITVAQLELLAETAQTVLDESRDVLNEARGRLMELKKERDWRKESNFCSNPLGGGMVAVMGGLSLWEGGMKGEGWCDLREVEFAIEWCGRLVDMVEAGELEAIQTIRLSQRLGDDITTYVAMFNATASVKEYQNGGDLNAENMFEEEDAWVVMDRVNPGMNALRQNIARDLIFYQDNMMHDVVSQSPPFAPAA
ncbi:hypothetical protein FRB95_002680 [Tulasnella sp. JGI-2019a]|nr:hypothetical protein FRB95_002680 [Tulasnella sp. JGI-2019a]